MLKTTIIVLVLVLAAFPVSAGDVAELQVINGDLTADIFVAGKIRGRIGWSAFALVSDGWAQVYAGPTYAPTSWSVISLNIGLETGGERFAESLWLGHDRFSMLAILEHGYTGRWHKITADYKLTKSWAVGYHGQAFLGNGARISYTFGKVTVWGSLLYRERGFNTVIAAKISN